MMNRLVRAWRMYRDAKRMMNLTMKGYQVAKSFEELGYKKDAAVIREAVLSAYRKDIDAFKVREGIE